MIQKDVDPRWREMSASLRRGVVYVKMPLPAAHMLLHLLQWVSNEQPDGTTKTRLQDLRNFFGQEIEATEQYSAIVAQRSFFYQVPYAEASLDAKALEAVEGKDLSGHLRVFRKCLENGSQGDPELDWIVRVGGPKPDSALEGLVKKPRSNRDPQSF